jgi:hypothetical protein
MLRIRQGGHPSSEQRSAHSNRQFPSPLLASFDEEAAGISARGTDDDPQCQVWVSRQVPRR